MKHFLISAHLLFLASSLVLAEGSIVFERNGVRIISTDLEPAGKYDPDLPRKLEGNLNSHMILKRADEFVKSAFGPEFKLSVAKISLYRKRSSKDFKYYWEWTVAYINPDDSGDVRSANLILIPISVEGKVLMSIDRARSVSAPRKNQAIDPANLPKQVGEQVVPPNGP